jgi:hypothetical protein
LHSLLSLVLSAEIALDPEDSELEGLGFAMDNQCGERGVIQITADQVDHSAKASCLSSNEWIQKKSNVSNRYDRA